VAETLKTSEAEQTAWMRDYVRRGMPTNDTVAMLILNRSGVVLPVIEAKSEEVLRSPSSSQCFSEPSVDPKKFIHLPSAVITEAGNLDSIRQAGKLMAIDEPQFGWMVEQTLLHARTYRNRFTVAYQALGLGDAAVDRRVATWARAEAAEKRPPQRSYGPQDPVAKPEAEIRETRLRWAEAMVEKYGGVPTESEWRRDPLVGFLDPAQAAAFHDPVIRAAFEFVEARQRRR
jgi:hypothetical protein